jgi:hypothetical protein
MGFAAHERLDGSASFDQLRSGSLEWVPNEGGVYLVLVPSGDVAITPTSCGGWFKQKDPTVAVEFLRSRVVEGAPVLYIGKANNLRRRLREYADFGAGKPIGHWGGATSGRSTDARTWWLGGSPPPARTRARSNAD